MGGVCLFYNKNGKKIEATKFTDNFQILPGNFNSFGLDWYSVEQAFQALKLEPEGRNKIHSEAPNGRNDVQYGNYVWSLGSKDGGFKMRSDWDVEKVKVMFILNIDKYIAHPYALADLVKLTRNARLMGLPSTNSNRHGKGWDYWNGAIQTEIRDTGEIENLKRLRHNISEMSGKEVEENLLLEYE